MRVYCLGDSMTYGYGVPRRETWVALTGAAAGYEMINAGVNGDTTSGMVARFCADVPQVKPDMALFMGGCNDIFLTGGDGIARCNMGALVQQSLARAVVPVICCPIPFEPQRVRGDWARLTDFHAAGETLRGYAAWLRQYAEIFRVTVLDFWSFFAALPAAQRTPLYLDGLHLTAEGHRLMAELALKTLQKLETQSSIL